MSLRAILLTCSVLLPIACSGKSGSAHDGGADMKPLPAQCMNSAKDGDETDVDCGGSACNGCDTGGACLRGTDCKSQSCVNNACAAPSCSDEVKNGDETDVDCGGSCPGCASDKACIKGTDCASGLCANGQCGTAAPSCSNGSQDGDETDMDCGGSCQACASGKTCATNDDCKSGKCEQGSCIAVISFTEPAKYVSGHSAYSLDISDIDRDGYPDIVTCEISGNDGTTIFWGSNTGIHTSDVSYVDFDCPYINLHIRDINGDEIPDLIALGNHTIDTLPGDVNRTFGAMKQFAIEGSSIGGVFRMDDLDHDGVQDAVVLKFNSVHALFGDTSDIFLPDTTIISNINQYSMGIGDLDQDDIDDIVTGSSASGIENIFYGRNNRKFDSPITTTTTGNPRLIIISDIDGDRLPELITGTNLPGISIRQMAATRVLGSELVQDIPFDPIGVEVADFDGDGKNELVIGCNSYNKGGALLIYQSTQSGSGLSLNPIEQITFDDINDIGVADLNHDGKPDIVIGAASNTPSNDGIYILLNTTK